jgi:hypothetical protein
MDPREQRLRILNIATRNLRLSKENHLISSLKLFAKRFTTFYSNRSASASLSRREPSKEGFK